LRKFAIFIERLKQTMSNFSLILSIAIGLSIFYPGFSFDRVIDAPFAQRSAGKAMLREQMLGQVSNQVPNIQGDWKMSISGENLSSTYSLIQKGNRLTGTFRAPLGTFPLTGTISNDNQINFSARSGGINLKFMGTVKGETMKGVADLPMKGRRNWTATK
jgi:hypothetical protein